MTAAWPQLKSYAPFPVFANPCHMSRGYWCSLGHLLLHPFWWQHFFLLTLQFCNFSLLLALLHAQSHLSLLLKVTGFIEGIFNVHSKLFRWVSPIPVCRHPRTALELTSWLSGRSSLTSSCVHWRSWQHSPVPHTAQVTENTEANPHFFLLLCSTMTNWLKIKLTYIDYSGKILILYFCSCGVFSLVIWNKMSTSKFLQKLTNISKCSELQFVVQMWPPPPPNLQLLVCSKFIKL